jgi:uncharacterized membrane protein
MGGVVGVIILNVVTHQILGLSGIPVTMAIAFALGGLVAFWFAKSEQRTPTSNERTRFLWQYAVAIALLFGLPILVVSLSQSIEVWTLLIVLVHWFAYPICAYLYMSDKYLGKQMKSLIQR